MQSVRAIDSKFSEGAENLDEMSSENTIHEPDDSDLTRALHTIFFEIPEMEVTPPPSCRGRSSFNCRRSSRPGRRVARRSACSLIDGADRTPHCIRALGNSRHTLAEVHMSLQNTEKVQKKFLLTYMSMFAPQSSNGCNGSRNPSKS